MKDWFRQVLYAGNMGINHVIRTKNKFLELKRNLEGTRKFWNDFPKIYESTYPKIEAILKLPQKIWEKEIALTEDDHWPVDMWKLDFDHRKEKLEQVLCKVELDIDWAKDIRADCIQYLKLMIGYDMPAVEIDPKKIKPYFRKMEDGMSSELTTNFMGFVAQDSPNLNKLGTKWVSAMEIGIHSQADPSNGTTKCSNII